MAAIPTPGPSLDPTRLTFLVGAGISIDPPTRLPSGLALTNQAFASLFLPDVFDATGARTADGAQTTVAHLHQTMSIVDRDGNPAPLRLEVLLGAAAQAGPGPIAQLLHDVIDAPPNPNHEAIGALTALGARVLTTNFDTCIERSASAQGRAVVHHLHQALEDPADVPRLGAFFSTIERGFPDAMTALLDDVLQSTDQLVVAGYSGSDHFDVNRYFSELSFRGLRLDHLRVRWLTHGSGPSAGGLSAITGWLTDVGATVSEEHVLTTDVLADVATAFGATVLPPTGSARPPTPPPDLDLAARQRNTYALYQAIGYPKGSLELIDQAGLTPGIEEATAIAWSEGRYTSARRQWEAWTPPDEAGRLRRLERIGGCLWAQGRLIPAWRRLSAMAPDARAALQSGDEHLVDIALGWADTSARCLAHMDRTELRLLPKRRIRRELLAALPDIEHLPFHTRERVREIRTRLEHGENSAEGAEVAAHTVDSMREAGNLAGYLNYRHRVLRDAAAAGHPFPTQDYVDLAEHMQAIGASGDATRVPFIPGGADAFTVKDMHRAFAVTEFGRWQQTRVLARLTLTHLLHRGRRYLSH